LSCSNLKQKVLDCINFKQIVGLGKLETKCFKRGSPPDKLCQNQPLFSTLFRKGGVHLENFWKVFWFCPIVEKNWASRSWSRRERML